MQGEPEARSSICNYFIGFPLNRLVWGRWNRSNPQIIMNPKSLVLCGAEYRRLLNSCLLSTVIVILSVLSADLISAATLPIEIAQGTSTTNKQTKNVPIFVPSTPGSIDRLWLKIHNVAYDDQVEVKAGTSSWIKLSNSHNDVIIEAKGKDYEGIGGGFRTLVIEVDIPNGAITENATNTISFRLGTLADANANGGPQIDISAYRVIDIDFRNTNGDLVLPNNAHTMANPNNYGGIPNTGDAKDRGRGYWKQQNKLRAYPGGPPISGSCASCHTHDGRDLKYFGYSNHSIVQRGRFHGLTELEAKDVASYIRSLPGGTPGRPWNPPYQPGPNAGNDSTGPYAAANWAAGAGLGAVKGSDLGSLDALFPDTNGNGKRDQSEIDNRFDSENGSSTGDRLETFLIPISVQLPDWNRWIPLMAPEDVWSDFRTAAESPYKTYENIRNQLDAKMRTNPNNLNEIDHSYYLVSNSRKRALVNLLGSLGKDTRAFIGTKTSNPNNTRYDPNNGKSGSQWRIKNGPRVTGHGTTIGGSAVYQREMAKRVISAWMSVKYFELMTEYQLEDKCPDLFNGNTLIANGEAKGERRGWPTAQQSVHANAPHITSATIDHWEDQDPNNTEGDYLSSVWYHLQMVLNAGQRQAVDTVSPQDWEYQLNHIYQLSDKSGRHEPLRFMQSMMKVYQLRDNKLVNKGWMLRMTHPWRGVSMRRGGGTGVIETLNSYDPGLHTRILNAMIKEYVDVVRDPSFDGVNFGSSWTRYTPGPGAGNAFWWQLEVANTPLVPYTTGQWFPKNNAQSFYNMFPHLKYLGAQADRINALKDWCEDAWTGTNWDTTTAPNEGSYYRIQNLSNSSYLRGENNLGSRPTLVSGGGVNPFVRWTPIAANGDEWFRLRRRDDSNQAPPTQYWLRMVPGSVGPNLLKVTMGNTNNTGEQTQWRFLPIGSSRFRIEGRAYGVQWLRGENTEVQHVDSGFDTSNRTRWKFVP